MPVQQAKCAKCGSRDVAYFDNSDTCDLGPASFWCRMCESVHTPDSEQK